MLAGRDLRSHTAGNSPETKRQTPELAPGPVFGPLTLQRGVESGLLFFSFSGLKSSGTAHWEQTAPVVSLPFLAEALKI